jgi:hypothetical protein
VKADQGDTLTGTFRQKPCVATLSMLNVARCFASFLNCVWGFLWGLRVSHSAPQALGHRSRTLAVVGLGATVAVWGLVGIATARNVPEYAVAFVAASIGTSLLGVVVDVTGPRAGALSPSAMPSSDRLTLRSSRTPTPSSEMDPSALSRPVSDVTPKAGDRSDAVIHYPGLVAIVARKAAPTVVIAPGTRSSGANTRAMGVNGGKYTAPRTRSGSRPARRVRAERWRAERNVAWRQIADPNQPRRHRNAVHVLHRRDGTQSQL